MRVDVDKTGRDDLAACINFLSRIACDIACLRDQPILYRNIAGKALCTRAIDNSAAANDQIECGHDALSSFLLPCNSTETALLLSSQYDAETKLDA